MRRSRDVDATVRRGARAGRPRLVVHLASTGDSGPATAAFAVSRATGGAVVRNRVKRRLRHLVAARIGTLPAGTRLVVRALPPAAGSGYQELGSDLDAALRTVLRSAQGAGRSRR